MAPTQTCASYQYVVTSNGPKILPVEDQLPKDEESPADYNSGGYLPVKVGDTFKNGRYRVVRKLGWGHFSTVWLVKDVKLKHHSALKVVKSAGRYAETARDEIKLLSRVAAANLNHPGRSHVVSFLDSFYYEGIDAAHVCIVFEPLGENLLAIIERHKKTGVPIPVVRSIAKQILLGLQYLHDECDLVHTDIKPENILISIPDVEQHILDELSQSPIPTSRRVGVPPVPKGRVGVVIPQGQHRSRRQVQIFESQPISSPKSSRSIGRYGHNSLSMSTGARPGPSESVPSSVPGSFVQMHISRLTSTKAMSASHPAGESNSSGSKPRHGAPAASAPSTKPGANHISPSTSSSSSSLNSTLESSNAGTSSIISTPPTSLSNSIGNVVSGFIGLSKASASISKQFGGADPTPTKGMPIKGKVKTTAELEDELNEACSSSWKSNLSLPSSFTDKLSSSLSSSFKSSRSGHGPSKLNQVQNGNDQPVNATSASHWKHPGTAAPAPAVVVSAVAAPDGTELSHHEYDYSETRVVPTKVDSETSSTAVTTAQPSRTTTPIESLTQKPTAIRHDSLKANSAQDSALSRLPSAPSQTKATPSLLTQTAPSKLTVLPRLKRPSPSTPVSQLTVNTRDSSASTPIPPPGQSTTTKSTDVTLPVAIPSDTTPPAAPPPTPVESLMVSANLTVAPNSSSALAYQAVSPIDVPLYEVPEPPVLPDIFVKIADLGNATPSKKHYTEEIQTRQYRAPEAILGKRDWDARADIWSVACVIFELLTAEYLFDPHGQGEHFSKDDDHMAQIIELVGDFALEAKMGGRYSREIFDHTGALRYIRALKPWPLKRVMTEKYLYSDAHSDALCAFLLPMLEPNIKKRAHARDLLEHPWLQPAPDDELVTEW